MTTSAPWSRRSAQLETRLGPIVDLADIPEGSLVFFARPSPLQTWAETFGHEWRHVGVLVDTGDGLHVASYGPRKCFRTDDLADLLGNYNRVGVARVFQTGEEVQRLRAVCRRFHHLERADAPYAFSSLVVGPLHLTGRRMSPGFRRAVVMAFITLYCWWMTLLYADRWAFVCSTFIWAALNEAKTTPLRIPLSNHPDDDAAYATPQTARDNLYARWLCGPTELWQAISPAAKCELDLDRVAERLAADARGDDVVIDLRNDDGALGACGDDVVIDLRDDDGALAFCGDDLVIDLRDGVPSEVVVSRASSSTGM